MGSVAYRNAFDKLEYLRKAIEREHEQLHADEYEVRKRQQNIERLTRDYDKVQKRIVKHVSL